MKVAIVGAAGQTGRMITNALLAQPDKFQVIALSRPASLQKPEILELEERGVQIVKLDLAGPEEDITKALYGIDVLISTMFGFSVHDEIPLIDAAKKAGVKRFIPSFFATTAPPKGALNIRDMKEDVLNRIKLVKLPYTVVDVGWWYQVTVPRLPSGRSDYALPGFQSTIPGKGNVPLLLSDIRDIGNFVARIITDPRTLNKMVLAYSEVRTHYQIWDMFNSISGEEIPRKHITAEDIEVQIDKIKKKAPPPNDPEFFALTLLQYQYSCGVRGDNTPENAEYLGYLSSKELYPDFRGIGLETYMQEIIDGKAERVYKHMKL